MEGSLRPFPPIALCLALAFPGIAQGQASLRIQPIMVDVAAPSQASAVTLQNTSPNPVNLQLRAFAWSQTNGEDVLAPTSDVVASPPAMTIPGGAAFTVRVARVAGPVASGEESYRLWVDELPSAERTRSARRAVDVRIRYDLPVFFGNGQAGPDLAWRAFRSGSDVVVEATNSGSGHARIERLKLGDISFGEGLNGYVLPGSTRRWTAPAGSAPPAANASMMLEAGVGESDIRVPITMSGN